MNVTETKRATVPAMEDMMGVQQPVLNKGFVRLVDYMGDDSAICQAARVSYGAGTKTVNEDRGLIRYLMRHRHTTPFEMCEIKLHVKLPVFVARQWIRHRMANVNEYSARYSILDKEFYVPRIEDLQPQSKTNKQGRDGVLPEVVRMDMLRQIEDHNEASYKLYDNLRTGMPWFDPSGTLWDMYDDPAERHHAQSITNLEVYDDREQGLARESARMVLPPNIYTQWYWKVDLHNLLHFLSLRADPHAQKEIRVYAEMICHMIAQWVPHAYAAFADYVMGAETFSRQEMAILRELVGDDPLDRLAINLGTKWVRNQGLSERELADLQRKLGAA